MQRPYAPGSFAPLICAMFALLTSSSGAQGDTTEAEGVVDRIHPGWTRIVRTSGFKQWLSEQPKAVKDLSSSETPADAVKLLDLYVRQERKGEPDEEPTRPLSPSEIFQKVSSSVVGIRADVEKGLKLGSGVVIGDLNLGQYQQIIITNAHVVLGAKAVRIVRAGKAFEATLFHADPDADLAILAVANEGEWPLAALGADPKSLQIGASVYAVGSPQGLENSLSPGIISGLRTDSGRTFLQTTAPISAGNSGGGLFDEHARLIGVTTFKVGGENLNFAVPWDLVAEMKLAAYVYVALVDFLKGEPADAWLDRLDAEANLHQYLVTPDGITGQRPAKRLWNVLGGFTDGKTPYAEALQQIRVILADFEQKKDQFPKHGVIRH